MKKKYIILGALFALGAGFTACDMDEEPQSSASVDMVFSAEKGCKPMRTPSIMYCLRVPLPVIAAKRSIMV